VTQANSADLVGRTIAGTYRIERKLGEGGMGAVFKALDVNLERPVALKVIRPDLGSSKDFVQRFKREGRAAAKFKHPNSVEVYALGEEQGLLWMALEFVNGRELREVIRENGSVPADRTVAIAQQILSALHKAHEQGIIHRDLKPQNIMVSLEAGPGGAGGTEFPHSAVETVKILDFGIAKMKEGDQGGVKTEAGTIMGTVAYMSPEQAKGEPVDGRSDLYAVGIILYQMLTGEVPFQSKSQMDLLNKQINQPAPPLRTKRPDVPEALERVILKALEKAPANRFPDARAFARALDESRGAFEATVVSRGETGKLDSSHESRTHAPTSTPPPTSSGRPDTALAYEAGATARVYASLVGRTLDDKYEVISKLGEGGMGAVF
jgi:serine/threonine-protein kinase